MTISTYATLQTAIQNWLDDSTLTDRIPEFIALAEAEFNRVLRATDQETVATLSASAETVALPSGFRAMRGLSIDGSEKTPLEEMSLQALRRWNSAEATGKPLKYAIARGYIYLAPIPDDTYSIECVYVGGITALADDNTTNWLLTSHPDLYLFGSLLQAEFFGWNDGRLPLLKARTDELIAQINAEANAKRLGVGPIRMRHGVSE